MRLPFRRKALTGTPEVVQALADRTLIPYAGLGGGATQRIREVYSTAQTAGYEWLYMKSPAVRTVIDVIVRNVGELDLRLYEEVDESERQARPDHPAALSLRYPSVSTPRDQFVRSMFKDFLIFDNAYALQIPAPGGTLNFKYLPAQHVRLLGADIWDAEVYRFHRPRSGTYIDFTPDQIVHWRGENPYDPRLGYSHLETLRDVIAEDAALQQATAELAQSGLSGPMAIKRGLDAPAWSNQARDGFDEWLEAKMKRATRRPIVLEEGMEPVSFGVSPRDAQMLDVRKWTVARVADEYGLPLAMVGLDDRRELDQARSFFYSDTLPPYCESFTRMLNLNVLVRVYNELSFAFEFNLDEKQMGDERIKTITTAVGAPPLTRNEGRAMLNRPPVAGGDDPITPLNVLVGDPAKPSPTTMPIQDPNAPAQDGSHRDNLPASTGAGARALTPGGKALEVTTVPKRMADLGRQRRYIDEAKSLFESYYRRQQQSLVGKSAKSADSERWNSELADSLHGLVSSIVEREGGIYAARLGHHDFDMRQVANYLKAMAVGTAEGVNAATQRDIADIGASDALDRARSERATIAATSVGVRATVFARQEAAKQAPGSESRSQTWIADTDRHAALDGVSVPLGSDWGGIEPGSEPNCACSCVIS